MGELVECPKCGARCTEQHLKINNGKCWDCNDNKVYGERKKKYDEVKLKKSLQS